MDFFKKKTDHSMIKSFLSGFMVLFLSIVSVDLSGQKSTQLIQSSRQETIELRTGTLSDSTFPPTEIFQKKSFIKGRLVKLKTNSPICFADISCSDKTSFTKSSFKGEFILFPHEFPATLKIRKFGFKDETIIFNNPNDSVLISLTPLEIHKNNSSNNRRIQYGLVLTKALEKFNVNYDSESPDHSNRELVYCRITSSVDSTITSLFERYAHMDVNKYALQGDQSDIARYASTKEYIPGLSENRLEFKIEPFFNLPMFVEGYIKRRGFFEQNGSQIALIEVGLEETKNVYYINVADTSIVYITSHYKSKSRNRIQGPLPVWKDDISSSAEISFSPFVDKRNSYLIDCIYEKEDFRLIQKNKPDQVISKSTLFCVIPDSSLIINAVKEHVMHETLTEAKQQINFNAKVSLSGKSTVFNSEIEKLLLKPYKHDFWVQNSYVKPDFKEQKQIQNWENDNRFYSEKRLSPAIEINGVDSLVSMMNNNIVAVEKVYVETDRPDYLAGDTIWFSAFVVDNLNMDSTYLSKILYVDLINADNKLEKHLKLIIKNGRARGDFTLNKDLKNGIFRIRAYTQYMRNFQSEYLFEKNIPVHQSNFNNLIIVNPVINKSADGDSVDLYLQTILPDEYKAQEKALEVFVRLNDTLSVRKLFSFQKDLNGSMGFFVSSSLSCSSLDIRLTLSGKEVISEQRLSLKLKSGINLQFFPESGKMIAGIETVIAFKALDNKSNPTEFEADIVDEYQNKITHVTGNKSGVGKFTFTPQLNRTYKAMVTLSGDKYVFNLPVTEPKGYILNFNSDSSEIYIKNNQNDYKCKHYLLVSIRGAVYTSIEAKLGTKTFRIHLPFETYPKGIVQITLFDSLFHPLAERLVFNNRPDQKMLIHVETDKTEYRQREKVNLTISVTDVDGNPVGSSLSMAVVDASKSDSLINSTGIESSLYLASELKGEINYKLINLADTTPTGNRNIDLVMMTQGWRNFLWNSIRYTNKLKELYPIEKGFLIDGTVFNYNKRRSGSDYKLNCFDLKTGFYSIVNIDERNRFKIDIPFFYDYHFLFIQNRNKKDKIDNLGFILDTVPVPVISYRNNELPYVLYRPGYLKTLNEKFAEIESLNKSDTNSINIPEVIIKAKSHPWNSKPDITINLDKKDPTGEKYSSLFQMIYEEFGEKAFTAVGYGTYRHAYNPFLIVNGTHLTAEYCPPCYDYNAYQWASMIPVNEISNVKFYKAGSEYSQFVTPPPPPPLPAVMTEEESVPRWADPVEYSRKLQANAEGHIYASVVSFATYSNSYRGNPRGTIVFPFQGIYQAREFYLPDYENNKNKICDNRTTIYWNPEVKTDSTGKARVSFYNSDLKGEALIRISGVSYYLKDASTAASHYMSH
ncbi:MAG: hypothetical protein ABR927_08795 [Bacteroidales bacterium]|jgi:hypothetical protein